MTTPKRETADQWSAPVHDHSHSVYVRCKDCLTFGIPMPNEYQCGNCSSHNTVSYNPPCCVEKFAEERVREAFKSDETLGKMSAMITNIACEKAEQRARAEVFEICKKIANECKVERVKIAEESCNSTHIRTCERMVEMADEIIYQMKRARADG